MLTTYDYSCEREVRHMAVAELMKSSLQLVFVNGTDLETGKSLYKSKTFNNVKTAATADQLYAIAEAISGLQELPLYMVHRKDSTDIHQG